MTRDEAKDVARLARAFSNTTRVLAFAVLAKGPTKAGALWRKVKVPEPMMSSHLALFRRKGLVHRVRKGKEIHYSVNRDGLAALHQFMALFK